jgi:hypothetical protein
MEDLNNEPRCIICEVFCEPEERGFNLCPTCRRMLGGSLVMICLNCSNAQFISLSAPVIRKVDSLRKGFEVHDVYESIFVVYDSCPRCYREVPKNTTVH